MLTNQQLKNNMKNHRLLEITLLLASMLTMLANAIISPTLPAITQAFSHIDNVETLTKLMLTLPALVIALFSPFAGRIIDNYGRIRILIISLLIYILAGTAGYWVKSLYALLFSRFILGFGVSGIMITATTLVGDYFTGKKREQFMGMQGAFTALGGLLFIPTAGYLADINWRFAFLVYGFAAIILTMVPFSLHEPKRHQHINHDNDNAPRVSNKVWFVYVSSFLTMLFFYIIPVQLPFLLTSFEGVSSNQVGLSIGFMMIAQATSAILSKTFRQKLSFISMYTLGFILIGIGYLIIGLSTTYMVATMGVMVVGLGLGSLIPTANLWIMSLVPDAQRGRYVGMLTRANFFGMFMSPLCIQPIQNIVGLRPSFMVISCILVVVASMYFFIIKPLYAKTN